MNQNTTGLDKPKQNRTDQNRNRITKNSRTEYMIVIRIDMKTEHKMIYNTWLALIPNILYTFTHI